MAAARSTTAARGLGHAHKVRALQLKRDHVEGTLCWWCGEPMYLAQGLHADHSTSRAAARANGQTTMADRLLHAECNEQRGDGHRDHLRPALTGVRMGKVTIDIGTRAMRWPL